ncbi:MAG: hypothetical protein IPH82_30300 [Chloroflexi bacterium]|nr:hypothetical protein [Chloroflexota bacterium]
MEAITVRAAIGELVNFGLAIRKEHHYAITHPLLHAYARQFPVNDHFAKLVTYYNSWRSRKRKLAKLRNISG